MPPEVVGSHSPLPTPFRDDEMLAGATLSILSAMPPDHTILDEPPVTILAIAAHRDDVELTCGGT